MVTIIWNNNPQENIIFLFRKVSFPSLFEMPQNPARKSPTISCHFDNMHKEWVWLRLRVLYLRECSWKCQHDFLPECAKHYRFKFVFPKIYLPVDLFQWVLNIFDCPRKDSIIIKFSSVRLPTSIYLCMNIFIWMCIQNQTSIFYAYPKPCCLSLSFEESPLPQSRLKTRREGFFGDKLVFYKSSYCFLSIVRTYKFLKCVWSLKESLDFIYYLGQFERESIFKL